MSVRPTHGVGQALGLQPLLLERLLQGDDLGLVLAHRQLHSLTGLGAALVRTQPTREREREREHRVPLTLPEPMSTERERERGREGEGEGERESN